MDDEKQSKALEIVEDVVLSVFAMALPTAGVLFLLGQYAWMALCIIIGIIAFVMSGRFSNTEDAAKEEKEDQTC